MAFSSQFLDELKMRTALGDIIGKHVKLIRKGHEFTGLCPFHSEKTPSFTVNEEKGFYHCFGCHAHGNVFDFIMEVESLNFREAVERLSISLGVEIPQLTKSQVQSEKKHRSLIDVMELATQFFENILYQSEGKIALSYLENRGLNRDIIKEFRIGFALSSKNALKIALEKNGLSEDVLVATGLIVKPERDFKTETYDRFRNRIIFPISNRRGQIIAFGGRALGNNEPKYLNSPETEIYHKGRELYGIFQAIPAIRKAKTIIVTEGYMDVIALHKVGIQNSVAPLGTALTETQLQILWRSMPEPTLCFDGDAAGQRASVKLAIKALPLLKPGFGLRFASLPPGEDPDSLINSKSLEVFKMLLSTAKPLSEFIWNLESNEGYLPSSPELRAALQQRLQDHTKLINDPNTRGHFLNYFNDKMWNASKSRSQKSSRKQKKSYYQWAPNMHLRKEAGPSALINIDLVRESILLAILINHPKAYDHIGEKLGTLAFISSELDKLRQEALKIFTKSSEIKSKTIVDQLDKNGYSETVGKVLSSKIYDHAYYARPEAPLKTVISGWNEVFEQLKSKDLISEIKSAEKDFAEHPSANNWDRLVSLKEEKLQDNKGELIY